MSCAALSCPADTLEEELLASTSGGPKAWSVQHPYARGTPGVRRALRRRPILQLCVSSSTECHPSTFRKKLSFGGLDLNSTSPTLATEPWRLSEKPWDLVHGCPLDLWAYGLELSLDLAGRSWQTLFF